MFDNFEFSFGSSRRESISERLERQRREAAEQRTEDLLRTLFGGVPTEVPVIVRTVVEQDTVMGTDRQEKTRTAIIKLVPGLKLAKQEIEPSVFGATVTTVTIEGLDHLALPIVTSTSERDCVFGKYVMTEIRIATQLEQSLGAARYTSNSTPKRTERVTVRVRSARRERTGFPF
jgi:hypothetical protein